MMVQAESDLGEYDADHIIYHMKFEEVVDDGSRAED